MKIPIVLTCCLGICLSSNPVVQLRAQAPVAEPAPAPAPDTAPAYSAGDLTRLMGPIALYPDALVGLILPASTTPGDVVMAARYLAAKGDPDKLESKPWDDSVKTLVRYPEVLQYMDQNLDWTTDVGEAFLAQPQDVMNSIQDLRTKAKTAGNLKDSPQQTVVVKEEKIVIMPADPEVIYVPHYDPQVVYVQSATPVLAPLITFGVGFAMGAWLNHGCNWYGGGVWIAGGGYHWGGSYNNNVTINNNYNFNSNNNWNHNGNNNWNGNGSQWKPNPNRPGTRPPAPGTRPSYPGSGNKPNRPGYPDNGGNRPSRPGGNGGDRPTTKPALPDNGGNRPSRPDNGGNIGDRPTTKPARPDNGGIGGDRPTTKPARPDNGGIGGDRPSTRPAQDRPTTMPAQRPNNSAFGGYDRGSVTRADSQRGQASRQQAFSSRPDSRSSGGGGGGGGGGGRGGRSGGGRGR